MRNSDSFQDDGKLCEPWSSCAWADDQLKLIFRSGRRRSRVLCVRGRAETDKERYLYKDSVTSCVKKASYMDVSVMPV